MAVAAARAGRAASVRRASAVGCAVSHSAPCVRKPGAACCVPAPHPSCLPCRDALAAYQEALAYAPNNKIALQRADFCRGRVERLGL